MLAGGAGDDMLVSIGGGATDTYRSFVGSPLFADAGPTAADVNQGAVGDCYYAVTLAAIADVKPAQIRKSVVDLGDGTYAVRFERASTAAMPAVASSADK